MVVNAVEGRGQLEEIFREPSATTHQRVLRTDVYIRSFLDIFIRDGARILIIRTVCLKFSISSPGC